MSANGDDSGPGRREVAHRVFATEFDAASLEYSSSEEERAPKYVVTPTGARVNRLFVVGVLTEVEPINDDVVRARIADPTGAFVVYAGQYQPEALAFLERTESPAFVAVTGKANTFKPDDSDRVFTSIRPESVNEVDAETRDRWTVRTAEHTLDRVSAFARALERLDGADDREAALVDAGFDETEAEGIALAYDHYGTTPGYLSALRETALDAARLVAGEVDAVEAPAVAPDEAGADVALADLRLDAEAVGEPVTTAEEPASTADETPEPVSASAAAEPAESSAEAAESAGDAGGADELEDFEPVAEPGPESTDQPETTEAAEEDTDETPDEEEPVEAAEPTEDVGMYELDEEERAEVEEEFGTEFSTGAEVDEPGEAGIDAADAEEEPGSDVEAEATPEETTEAAEAEPETEAVEEPEGTESEEEEPTDVNVEDAAMEAMRDHADGDGADRDEVVASVVEEHGVDPEAVEDAIQDALMSGRCYEPQDGVLKPI